MPYNGNHYTMILEIQEVTFTGGAVRGNTADKMVNETARVVIRNADLHALIAKAIQHLEIMRDSPMKS